MLSWYSKCLIIPVMVSSLLLPAFRSLSFLLYFWFPSTFLPSKGRSVTTLGTRWHDFFHYPFRYFIYIYFFIAFLLLFLRVADSRKSTLCPFCVPIHKKEKKKHIVLFCYMSRLDDGRNGMWDIYIPVKQFLVTALLGWFSIVWPPNSLARLFSNSQRSGRK